MIEGIFYEQKPLTLGSAGTAASSSHALHYYAKENSKGDVELFFLKPDGTHTKFVALTVNKADFLEKFGDCAKHECQFKKKTAEQKKAEKVSKQIKVAQEHLQKKEYHAATFEFGKVLKEDDKNLEAHLGKGKAHMALGETDEAKKHFDAMAESTDLFDRKNLDLFNELGIELRKNEMFDEALRNYRKALEIDSTDEALYFNMSRAYKEWGRKDEALGNINKALELKNDFVEAKILKKEIEDME
ncbi:MAG: tetratricopeptide repeat protein [Nitrospinota bacterium]|nr:tetratricopeptide repeat protein [Nitrospinota bacterium]